MDNCLGGIYEVPLKGKYSNCVDKQGYMYLMAQRVAKIFFYLITLVEIWLLYFLDFFPPSNRFRTTHVSAVKQN